MAKTTADNPDPSCERRRRKITDPFFAKGDKISWKGDASIVFYTESDSEQHDSTPCDEGREEQPSLNQDKFPVLHSIPCAAPHCCQTFKTARQMEDHYDKCHSFQCATCGAMYEGEKLLDLHLLEAHDVFFQESLKRGKSQVECLCCDGKFSSIQERLEHLMEKHQFPKWFRFVPKSRYLVDEKHKNWLQHHHHPGRDAPMISDEKKAIRRQRQKEKRSKVPCKFYPKCWRGDKCMFLHENNLDALTDQFQSLLFVPDQISFGRKRR